MNAFFEAPPGLENERVTTIPLPQGLENEWFASIPAPPGLENELFRIIGSPAVLALQDYIFDCDGGTRNYQ